MSQMPDFDHLLGDWLADEGPQDVPTRVVDAGLDRAHATRRLRPLPTWLVPIRGGPMETTWRTRTVLTARPAFLLLIILLVLALAAGAGVIGSRLLTPHRALPGPIPHGADAILAYGVHGPNESNGDVYTVRADGTDTRHIGRGFDPAWSPDGSKIAYYSNDAAADAWDLKVADAENGERTIVTGVIPCLGLDGQGAPTWSPDSRFLIYLVLRGPTTDCGSQVHDFSVIAADGSSPGQPLLASPLSGLSAAWSPTAGGQIALQARDGLTSSLWVADVPDPAAPWGLTANQISDASDYGSDSWAFPRWSPDGTRIATYIAPGGSAAYDAIVIGANGSDMTRLYTGPVNPSGPENDGLPTWSPDGSRLSLLVQDGPEIGDTTRFHGFLVNPDGTNPWRMDIGSMRGTSTPIAFSPDGTWISVQSLEDGGHYAMEMAPDGSPPGPTDIAPALIAPASTVGSGAIWQPVLAPRFGTPQPLTSAAP